MTAAPPTADRRHSNAFARERDARIRWLLDAHPVTAAMLVSLGFFPNRNKALKRLHRLVRRNRVKLVGTVSRKAGRPEHVYCRYQPKVDQLLHEVELTELCFRIDAAQIFRGPHLTDRDIRPDAELVINGRRYYLEHDRGSMGYGQIRRRYAKYEGSPHLVLWVCPTEARREGLRRCAERVRHVALFTTFASALKDPHAEIWLDFQGGKVALPRQQKGDQKAGPPPG